MFKLANKELRVVSLIILISIFFRFYQLELNFPFSWDQERDALEVWKIIKEGDLTLIGPSAAGFDTFYLGPLWYYLLAPFYFIFKMDPIGAAFFASLTGVITTIFIYFVFKKLSSRREAIIGSLIWAILPNRTAWNPMLIPLLCTILIFLNFKITQYKKNFIIWAFLLTGLGLQVHFQSVFFLPLLLISLFYYRKQNKLPVKHLIIGPFLFLLTFMPIIFFDLRHDFLNTKGIANLFFGKHGSSFSNDIFAHLQLILQQFVRPIHLSFFPFLNKGETVSGALILSLSFIGIYLAKISQSLKVIILTLIMLPPLILSFYKGQLSEYYFTVSIVPVLFGVTILGGIICKRSIGKLIIVLSLILIFLLRLNSLLSNSFYPDYKISSLYYKKQVVKFIVSEKIDPIFNISYTSVVNENSGFAYLFKLYGREPQNIPQGHLWTIVIPASSADVQPIARFGDIGIIRR